MSTLQHGIAVITLDHPPVNSLSQALRERIVRELDAAQADPAVRAVVLRAPGLLSVEDVARGFVKAPRKEVESLLDSLAAVGIIGRSGDGERRWRGVR